MENCDNDSARAKIPCSMAKVLNQLFRDRATPLLLRVTWIHAGSKTLQNELWDILKNKNNFFLIPIEL